MFAELARRRPDPGSQRLEFPRLQRGIGAELGRGPYRQLAGDEGDGLLLVGERMDQDFELLRIEGERLKIKSRGHERVEAFDVGHGPVRRDAQRPFKNLARLDRVDYDQLRPPHRIRRERSIFVAIAGRLIGEARIIPLRQQIAGQLKALGDLVDAREVEHVQRNAHLDAPAFSRRRQQHRIGIESGGERGEWRRRCRGAGRKARDQNCP